MSRTVNYVMGVDIGTQSTKALLVDAQGTIIAQHSQGYRVDTPKVRWAEQWPQVWLEAVEACVAHCMAKAGVAKDRADIGVQVTDEVQGEVAR